MEILVIIMEIIAQIILGTFVGLYKYLATPQ
jgi:hypothetical protein